MRFIETALRGAFVIELEPELDARGFFARTWDRNDWKERGLDTDLVQASVSFNERRGTLRGLHLQVEPHAETKTIRCTMGALWDVIVDLRVGSPTYGSWVSIELSAQNRLALYVPKGLAQGFITLTDSTEVHYQMSVPYEPSAVRGYRWDDPAFGIRWPLMPSVISDRDAVHAPFLGLSAVEASAVPAEGRESRR